MLLCRGGEVTNLAYHPSRNMAATTSSSGDFKVWVQQHEHKQGNKAHWMCQSVGSFRGMSDDWVGGLWRALPLRKGVQCCTHQELLVRELIPVVLRLAPQHALGPSTVCMC